MKPYLLIFGYANALEIATSQIDLGTVQPLFGRFPIPFHCLTGIRSCAIAIFQSKAQIILGNLVICVCCFQKLFAVGLTIGSCAFFWFLAFKI